MKEFSFLKKYEEYKKQQEEKETLAKKKQLIPAGGTHNWLLNCERNNYQLYGYDNVLVCKIEIAHDCYILVEDHVQPSKGNIPFFTAMSFNKKEIVSSHQGESVYNREYNIYYPYGTRFDNDFLKEIGVALNSLIDCARDIKFISLNKSKIKDISERQKQLIELFFNGTKDENAVKTIMNGIKINNPYKSVRKADYKKDFLPYFYYSDVFSDLKKQNDLEM